MNFFLGMRNIFIFWLALIISLNFVSIFRKKKFEKELDKHGISLQYVGKGWSEEPLQITQKILKWW